MESFTRAVSGICGKAYDMFTVNGRLFNHETSQRGETFVTRNKTGAVEHNAAGQLADSVNIWGDIPNTGRFLIPKGTTLPELMSYAGGPKGLNLDLFNILNVKISVNISRYLGPEKGRSEVKNFEFKYKEPIPAQLNQFNLQNNDVVSIEVPPPAKFFRLL